MWSVFFVFLSYLDRNFVKGEFLSYSLDGEKEGKSMFLMLNSTFCAKMSVIGENYLYQVSDGVEEVRSVRNPAGKLVDCSVTVNQMQVKSFMHICRLGLKDQMTKLEHFETSFAHLVGAKADCQEFLRKTERKRVVQKINAQPIQEQKDEKVNSASNKENVLSRSKRGFTYPGTLWCGAGNMADDVNQLGVFAETDNCCRVHDHCPHVIHAFSSNYGYTNFKLHSISHCDCDNAMKECLRKVNDSSSRIVGQAFFNVMEVPCFEFTYEEQCVERHWYGMCKKFEKMPVAVAKQSIPYDFGGIDVIDVLTLAPPKNKESDKSGPEQVRPEGPTEPPVSGSQTTSPEEPSLSNVVTAAEDFIKVLATVSTSQSSTTETAKGEAQSSEKKKKKNSEKKKNKKKKAKGRGRKRKQRVESISKAEEAAPGTSTSSKAEEVINKSDFVDEPSKVFQFNRNVNDLIDGAIDLGGREEPSNDVMKDQPMTDEDNTSIATSITATSPVKEQKQDSQAHTENKQTALLSVTIRIPITMQQKRQKSSKGRKKPNYISPTSSSEPTTTHKAINQELPVKTTDTSVVPSSTPPIPSDQLEQQRLGPTTITALTSIVTPFKRNRHRSKERKNRNKRRRISFSPIEEAQHSSKDDFRAITGSPTTSTVKTATDLESHRPENDRDWSPLTTSTTVTTTASISTTTTIDTLRATATSAAVSSTTTTATSTLNAHQNKRQQSKEREGRKRRKKLVLPLLADATSPQSASEETMSVLSATDGPSGLTVLTMSTMGLFAVGKDGKHGRLTATAGTPVLTAGGHRSREGEHRKRRKKNSPAINPYNDNEPDARTKTTARLQTTSSDVAEIEELKGGPEQVLYAVQPSTQSMSLIQSILQKAEEQLDWKRRRKNKASS